MFPIRLVAGIGWPGSSELAHDPGAEEEIGAALVMAGYPATVEGLEDFQRDAGLDVSGEIDPETLDALGVQIPMTPISPIGAFSFRRMMMGDVANPLPSPPAGAAPIDVSPYTATNAATSAATPASTLGLQYAETLGVIALLMVGAAGAGVSAFSKGPAPLAAKIMAGVGFLGAGALGLFMQSQTFSNGVAPATTSGVNGINALRFHRQSFPRKIAGPVMRVGPLGAGRPIGAALPSLGRAHVLRFRGA